MAHSVARLISAPQDLYSNYSL